MKHFWVFTFVSIIITAFFGGFAFPEKGYAQSIDTQNATNRILNADGTVNKSHQITPAEYDSLKSTANDIDFISDFINGYGEVSSKDAGLSSVAPTLNDLITWINSSPLDKPILSRTNIPFGKTIGGEYLGTLYLKILNANYDSSKNLTGTTKSTLEVKTLNDFIVELNKIINTKQVNSNVGAGLVDANPRDLGQARVVLPFANGKLLIAESLVKFENGQITADQRNAIVANASQTLHSGLNATTGGCVNIIGTFLPCLDEGLTWLVKNILLEIVGFFLWMSANLLNFAMYHGVFEFKKFAPDDIYNIWLVVRQIISLFVFFTGLFVGFMAIIGKSEEFKKYIAFLVVFGLFVNFSYPIVRVFVDVSNVVSLQIYQTALGKNVLSDNPSGDETAGAKIMANLGLQGLVTSATTLTSQATSNKFLDQVTSLPGAIAVVGFVGYAAYIFFMAAFLIIIRTALLVCIIIASPILLVDTIVPALGEKAKWLRGMFVSQLFVAPVFTIMLALTLKFLAIFSSVSGMSGSTTTLATAASASTSSVAIFFNLIMMLTMLHIMLKVTKAVAGGVGDTVTNWAGKAGGLGTGLALGAGAATFGFATRNTVGRFAKNMGDKDFGGGVLGNLTKDAFKGMGGAKYDLRNLSATGAIAGTLGITGMGKGAEKGYDKNREDYEKETYERASEIKDDGEREGYLKRKFNTSNFAKFTGTASQNAKAYSKFIKEDDDVIKQYVNSDEDGRKKLSESEKNTKFLQRFGNVDKYYDSRTTEEEKNMLKARMSVSTQKAVEEKSQQDDGTVESYINSNETQRARMAANAKNKNLKSRFEDVDKYYDTTATPEDRATIRGRIGTDDKRALDDNDKRLAEKDSDKINKAAQLSAVEATKAITDTLVKQNISNTEATNLILNKMVEGNKDIAESLKKMIKTNEPTPTQAANSFGGVLNVEKPTTLYQTNNMFQTESKIDEGVELSEGAIIKPLITQKEAVPVE